MTPEEKAQAIYDAVWTWDMGIWPTEPVKAKLLQLMADALREAQPRWIPVEERLPGNENGVLIAGYTSRTSTGIFIDTGWFDRGEGYWDGWNLGVLDIVTHWQPLPEPPTEELE